MAPESAECSLSDASRDDGSEDECYRSPAPSDSSTMGWRAPRARLLLPGKHAAASVERGLGRLAFPRTFPSPRDLESAPPRARAERPREPRSRALRPRTGAATRPGAPRPRTGASVMSTSGNCGASRLACARTWVQTRSTKTAFTPVVASAYAQMTCPLRASCTPDRGMRTSC